MLRDNRMLDIESNVIRMHPARKDTEEMTNEDHLYLQKIIRRPKNEHGWSRLHRSYLVRKQGRLLRESGTR